MADKYLAIFLIYLASFKASKFANYEHMWGEKISKDIKASFVLHFSGAWCSTGNPLFTLQKKTKQKNFTLTVKYRDCTSQLLVC